MAKRLICWKKGDEIKNKRGIIIYERYKHSDREKEVSITTLMPYLHATTVMELGRTKQSPSFKTKSQALRFAKSYMRKHDKC